MKLSERLRKDAAEVTDAGRKAGLDWQITETHQWQAADLLDKCEAALADELLDCCCGGTGFLWSLPHKHSSNLEPFRFACKKCETLRETLNLLRGDDE